MPKQKNFDESVEQSETINPHLANIRSCFKCGWAEELGAKLKVVSNENVCQKCRARRAAEEI